MTDTGTQAHFEERKKLAKERAEALGIDLDGAPLENLAADFQPDFEKAANLAKAIQNKDKLIEEVVKGLNIDNKAKAVNGVGLGLGQDADATRGRGPGPFGSHATMAQLTASVADLLAPGAMLRARIELSNLTTIKNQADRVNISEDEAHDAEMKRRRDFEVYLRFGNKALNVYREKHGDRPAYPAVMDWRNGELVNVMTTSNAGEYVPESFSNEIIERLTFFGGLREAVPGQTIPFSRKLNLGTANESAALGERLAENGAMTHLDVATDEVEVNFERYSSKFIDVSNTLIRDSHYDFISRIFGWATARIWRLQNQGWTSGVEGSNVIAVANRQYRSLNDATANGGLPTGYTAPNSDAQVTSIKYPSLPLLYHSVDPIHRSRGGRIMLNDNSIGKFAMLVDGNGRPLWVPSMRDGEPDRLFGIPYTNNNNMPNMAASAKSIIYGSFEGMQLFDVTGAMRFLRLDSEEAYAGKNMTGFGLDMYSTFHPDGASQAAKFFINAAS